MSDLDAIETLIATATECGYTREEVLAWRHTDLVRFGDELNARLAADQAELDFMREVYRERFGHEAQ